LFAKLAQLATTLNRSPQIWPVYGALDLSHFVSADWIKRRSAADEIAREVTAPSITRMGCFSLNWKRSCRSIGRTYDFGIRHPKDIAHIQPRHHLPDVVADFYHLRPGGWSMQHIV